MRIEKGTLLRLLHEADAGALRGTALDGSGARVHRQEGASQAGARHAGEGGNPEPSRGVHAPLFVGELRVEGSRLSLFVVDDAGLSVPVDSRQEGAEIIRELRAAAKPLPVLNCRVLWDLELGGAPHDPTSQDPHDADFSCDCVRPRRRAAIDVYGGISYPAKMDDPGPCHCGEEYIHEGRVQVRLCCRCAASLSTADFNAAVAALAGALSPTPALNGSRCAPGESAGERPERPDTLPVDRSLPMGAALLPEGAAPLFPSLIRRSA